MANNVPDTEVSLIQNVLGLGIPGAMARAQDRQAENVYTAIQAQRRQRFENLFGPGTQQADLAERAYAVDSTLGRDITSRLIGDVTQQEVDARALAAQQAEATLNSTLQNTAASQASQRFKPGTIRHCPASRAGSTS